MSRRKKKEPPLTAFDGVKIVSLEKKFKAKRDEHLLKKLQDEVDKLHYWFYNTYEGHTLKVHNVLSRKMEEVEVRKELKYYSHQGVFSVVALTDTIDSHTWYRPDLMEKYIENYVESHKKPIQSIMERAGIDAK